MLHYRTHGSPEQPAVCFLHGFMGRGEDWNAVTEALASDAYCLIVDLPGHGRSTGRPAHEYTMEGVAQSLADVLDDAGVDRCPFVGYSMGGRVALYLATFHPDCVSRLVLESASPGIESPSERAERRQTDAERASALASDFDDFLADWYRMPLFESLQEHGLVDDTVASRRHNDPEELAQALRGYGVGQQPSLWERLPDLQIPTLLVTGALDKKYVAVTERAACMNDAIRRVVVPDAGHNVHLERPQAYVAHLVDCLARNGRG